MKFRHFVLIFFLAILVGLSFHYFRYKSNQEWIDQEAAKIDPLEGFSPLRGRMSEHRRESCANIFFAGHIYPKNGVRTAGKLDFPDPDNAMDVFLQHAKAARPFRTILGGDSVYSSDQSSIDRLLEIFRGLEGVVFVSGNHDNYWEMRGRDCAGGCMFPRRYYFEDVSGVRLIYLHSVNADDSYGIDRTQRRFLASTLNSGDYRYALVFLHHALWAGDRIFVNEHYRNPDDLKKDWLERLMPLFKQGRVAVVFSGDGGKRVPGVVERFGGITHVITGWPGRRTQVPAEWLSVGLCDVPRITRYRLTGGAVYEEAQ